MSKAPSLADALALSFAQLADFVERGGIKHGTSATVGVSQIEINGKWYELQFRLEGKEESFIGETSIVQAHQLGDTKTLS